MPIAGFIPTLGAFQAAEGMLDPEQDKQCKMYELPQLPDVVVVGSGITGVLAAQELVDAGRNVVMLEAREAY
ncbi:hypothetical protein F5X98DRAFT_381862 [Xylaria grammica]|nr:hypothetical protein F5X98DRAFT_381862 [Xylaria grammica]